MQWAIQYEARLAGCLLCVIVVYIPIVNAGTNMEVILLYPKV